LVILHPVNANVDIEYALARQTLAAVRSIPFARVILIHPNNDPGARGIVRCWDEQGGDSRIITCRNADRPQFLGLLRDASVLVGNSSAGIIEAASFGTPVIDIGPRQLGRERSEGTPDHLERRPTAPLSREERLRRGWHRPTHRQRPIIPAQARQNLEKVDRLLSCCQSASITPRSRHPRRTHEHRRRS
jgi:hypothetical protein